MTTLIILAITFIVALGIWSYFNTQRELQALSELVCPSCDTRYGIAQAKLAREEHLASCLDIKKRTRISKLALCVSGKFVVCNVKGCRNFTMRQKN
jgi:hypothetical protein